MGLSTFPRRSRHALLWSVVAINLVGILFAGLNFDSAEFTNEAAWSADGTGMAFGRYGLAYTDRFSTRSDDQGNPGFTLALTLSPRRGAASGFRFIAVIHSGDERSQFLVAQWRQTVIVMNGDDYDYRRRLPRLTASIPDGNDRPVLLVVRSDAGGSELYLDGQLVDSDTQVIFRLPTDRSPGRLVLGNSPYGTNPWRGTILGLTLYSGAQSVDVFEHRRMVSCDRNDFVGGRRPAATLWYPLCDQSALRALDRSSSQVDLAFPIDTTFIEPRFFTVGDRSRINLGDMAINLGGFIPFGFFLAILLATVSPTDGRAGLLAAIGIGLALSASIELAQGWIPSRSSSLLDLLCNGLGTGLGAVTPELFSRMGLRKFSSVLKH